MGEREKEKEKNSHVKAIFFTMHDSWSLSLERIGRELGRENYEAAKKKEKKVWKL